MSAVRRRLEEALRCYTTDTLNDIQTVRNFCKTFSIWVLRRNTELEKIRVIKDIADIMNKAKLIFTQCEAVEKNLQKVLEKVLKETLGGLEMLQSFLNAIEKLAVSSVHVFMENQVIQLPEDISFDYVQVVINNAKLICPLLLEFKRDTKVFFLPKMQTVEVIAYYLDRYIQTTKKMCEEMDKSCLNDGCLTMEKVVEKLDVDLSEVNMHKMLDHIYQLMDIRMDQNFRMVFLFQEESCFRFIKEFRERQPRMLEFINMLKAIADLLEVTNKGAKISNIAGRSVGAVGGVMSVISLALVPVTAGGSLAFSIAGLGLGITSGVNNLVTTAAEVGVNWMLQKTASIRFQSFMEDVTKIQNCMVMVSKQENIKLEPCDIELLVGIGKVLWKAGALGVKCIASIFKLTTSAANLLKSEDLVSSAGKVAFQEGAALCSVSGIAADLPDIGEAAVKSSIALSESAKLHSIAKKALSLGIDIYFICKDTIKLNEDSKTDMSLFIRARAALWSSEIDSWKKIHVSLCRGLQTSEKKKALLETPFYLNSDVEKLKDKRRSCLTKRSNK